MPLELNPCTILEHLVGYKCFLNSHKDPCNVFYHWQDLKNTKFVLAVCLKIIGFGVSEKLKCNFEIAEFSSAMIFFIKKCVQFGLNFLSFKIQFLWYQFYQVLTKIVKASKYLKISTFESLNSSELISRKIWVTEQN